MVPSGARPRAPKPHYAAIPGNIRQYAGDRPIPCRLLPRQHALIATICRMTVQLAISISLRVLLAGIAERANAKPRSERRSYPLLGGPQCAKRTAHVGHLSRGGLGKPLGQGEGGCLPYPSRDAGVISIVKEPVRHSLAPRASCLFAKRPWCPSGRTASNSKCQRSTCVSIIPHASFSNTNNSDPINRTPTLRCQDNLPRLSHPGRFVFVPPGRPTIARQL